MGSKNCLLSDQGDDLEGSIDHELAAARAGMLEKPKKQYHVRKEGYSSARTTPTGTYKLSIFLI